eukprot:6183085-Pleurochrysis_carterae.AAC.2
MAGAATPMPLLGQLQTLRGAKLDRLANHPCNAAQTEWALLQFVSNRFRQAAHPRRDAGARRAQRARAGRVGPRTAPRGSRQPRRSQTCTQERRNCGTPRRVETRRGITMGTTKLGVGYPSAPYVPVFIYVRKALRMPIRKTLKQLWI